MITRRLPQRTGARFDKESKSERRLAARAARHEASAKIHRGQPEMIERQRATGGWRTW